MNNILQIYRRIKIRAVGSHELSSLYFKQVNATVIIKSVSVIVSLIYVPIVLGYLDKEKYGIWVTLVTLMNWIRLMDIGIGGGMRVKLSEEIALNRPIIGRIHVSTTYGIIGGVFLLVLIGFHFINPLLDWQKILNTSMISRSELYRLTTISVTFFILGFILQTVNLIYRAHGNTAADSLIHLIISITTLFLIWLTSRFTHKGNIILLATIVTGIPPLIYSIVSVYVYYFKFPHFRPTFKLIKIRGSKALFKLSLQSFVSSLTWLIIYGSIPIVVTHLFNPEEVTVYNIAYGIYNVPLMLIGLLVNPIKPLVTLAYTKKDYDWIRQMLSRLKKLSIMVILGTVIMIVFNQYIYHIWIGDKVKVPFILSASIGIYVIISILQTPYSIIILGTPKIKINTILSPIIIGLFLTISIVLSSELENVIGVSIALGASCLVQLIALPIWLRKILSE